MNHSNLLLSFFFIFFAVSSSSSSNVTIHKCSKQQSDALLLFKQSLSHTNFQFYLCKKWLGSHYYPIMRNWNTSLDCCSWNGVTCDRVTGDVIGLDLSCGLLRGTIHPNNTLFQLLHLKRLNLASNECTGSNFLPPVIGRFASTLTHLNISGCQFSGQIPPEISFLPKLVSLDLSSNYDLHSQPYVLNNLLQNSTHLRDLVIGGVDMYGCVLSTYLNISSSLRTVGLGYTRLQGKLGNNIFSLPHLEKLDLSYNTNITVSLPKVNKSTTIPLKWLDLSNTNSLLGEIPDSIFHLKSLNYLDLSSCGLRGSLPKSLIDLSHLITLDLSYNILNGTLPSFVFTLPFLQNIHLSNNMFSGGLPIELFNHQSLMELDLYNNQFDGVINAGSNPPSFINLTNLIFLDLSHNSFKGLWELDTLLSSLPNLIYLDLSYNDLSVVTRNVTSHANPNFLRLGLTSCKLTVFPKSLRAMKRLESLDLSRNDMGGHIPDWADEIGRNDLQYLSLSHNLIAGLPQFQWKGLEELYLRSNEIQGTFPQSICNMKKLKALDISENRFNGVIPQCVENTSTLVMINLGTNHFHGTIPNMCNGNRWLEGILLNGNQLEGDIPIYLSNCSFLRVLDLGNNHLNGRFPSWLGGLIFLEALVLKSNDLCGSIDMFSGTEFPNLRILDLSNNRFEGHLPQQYFQSFHNVAYIERKGSTPRYLMFMFDRLYYSIALVVKGREITFQKIWVGYTVFDLSNNNFEGEIPNVIGSLNSLVALNLSHNLLKGQIPHDLANLVDIEALDLSWNKLVGEIPQSLLDITSLDVLNLSQNNLKGRIPEGNQLSTFDESSYWGNPKLCGLPLPKSCEYESFPPPFQGDEDEDEDESLFTWKVVMLGYGCGTILGFIMGYVMLSVRRPRWFIEIVDAGESMIQTKQKKRRHIYIGK